jgi:hypothetical protein
MDAVGHDTKKFGIEIARVLFTSAFKYAVKIGFNSVDVCVHVRACAECCVQLFEMCMVLYLLILTTSSSEGC